MAILRPADFQRVMSLVVRRSFSQVSQRVMNLTPLSAEKVRTFSGVQVVLPYKV